MLQDLMKYPIIQAPMAGGASTPKLAATVSAAGGLGFLAAGYKTAEEMRNEMEEVRRLTGRPFGVNVFVPSKEVVDESRLTAYREKIQKEAESVGASIGEPMSDDDDWVNKIAVLKELRVAVVSFTFGCPESGIIKELQHAGTLVTVSVTNPTEAQIAVTAGADILCVQGIEAGGHRASFDNESESDQALLELIKIVKKETNVPIIAAGGLMDGKDISGVLAAGAVAAQLGTAFLCCPESGASPAHKAALHNPRFTDTAITRAFSGRRARGLVNRFLMEYDRVAPATYPYVHHMTKQMRKVAGQKGEPELMALWAGEGYKRSRTLPASVLMGELVEEMNIESRRGCHEN
ncbi:nitronate monooxygenase [Peribacillus sp. NPDC097264]|uniref:nitronate monooxygenase n=1 Tax=Peribacillus sp. NPDC097264 TaxID=3390616 RepID=UPI003CFEA3D6